MAEVLDRIKQVVGPQGWLDDRTDIEPYELEWRGLYRGKTALVVRPANTEQVAAVVGICAEAGLPIVPQGGNTGLCGGGVPNEDGHNIVLALGRMNKVRTVDPANFTITVEAGVILADIQRIAAEHDRLFPLSLGAEGTCQIGGNLFGIGGPHDQRGLAAIEPAPLQLVRLDVGPVTQPALRSDHLLDPVENLGHGRLPSSHYSLRKHD